MKTVKRMLAVFLAVMVSVALAPGVFAADSPGAPAAPPVVEAVEAAESAGNSEIPGESTDEADITGGEISAFGEVSAMASTHDVGNSDELADALGEAVDGDTISLTADITYNSGISINGIKITFELNGFVLDVISDDENALEVYYGGEVELVGGGALNVECTGSDYGNAVYASGGSKVNVTNAKGSSKGVVAYESTIIVDGDVSASFTTDGAYGVYAYGNTTGGFVTVGGDVSASGAGLTYGAMADNGSSISIEGNVTANSTSSEHTNYGVSAVNQESSISVGGNVSVGGKGSSMYGAHASGGGNVNVEGNVIVNNDDCGYETFGAQAIFANSAISIGGDVYSTGHGGITGTTGVYINGDGSGTVDIGGSVFANGYETYTECINANNGTVIVGGDISAHGNGKHTMGIRAQFSGTEVFVKGNVSSFGGDNNYGVQATSGCKATIDGGISVSPGGIPLWIHVDKRDPAYPDPTSAKPGYDQYSHMQDYPNDPSACTVWVKTPKLWDGSDEDASDGDKFVLDHVNWEGGGTLTVEDGAKVNIVSEGPGVTGAYIANNSIEFIIGEGGRVNWCADLASSTDAISLDSEGTFNVSGGSISAGDGGVAIEASYGDPLGSITIGGGTVSSTTGNAISTAGPTIVKGGTVSATSGYAIDTLSNVVINGGTVQANGNNGRGISDRGNSTVTVTGGTVQANGSDGIAISGGAGSAVTVTGGTVQATGTGGRAIQCADVTVKGGTVSAASGRAINSEVTGSTVTVEGGTVEAVSGFAIATIGASASDDTGGITVSGGTVRAAGGRAISTDNIGDGHGNLGNSNPVTVSGDAVVSTAAGLTISAFGAVTISGGTVSSTAGITIVNARPVNINGGTVETETGTAVICWYPVTVDGGTVRATGVGGIAISTNSYGTTVLSGTVSATSGIAIEQKGPNNITINGGTVETETGIAISNSYSSATSTSGFIAVSGGIVRATGTSGTAISYINGAGGPSGSITVGGTAQVSATTGTAINTGGSSARAISVSDSAQVSATTGTAINTIGPVSITGGTVSTRDGYAIYSLGAVTVSDGGVSANNGTAIRTSSAAPVTVSGGTVSATSGTAINSSGPVALSGGTVSATSGTAINSSGPVALNGGTVTASEGVAIESQNINVNNGAPATVSRTAANSVNQAIKLATAGSIIVNGATAELTVNGNIVASGAGGITARSGGKLTVNGDVNGTGTDDIGFVFADNATIIIKGDVNITDAADNNNVQAVYADSGGSITVGGVSITAAAGAAGDCYGAAADNGGIVTVNGTITAPIYIVVGGVLKTEENVTDPTTKTDYFTYTDGTSTVWVFDPEAIPVCSIGENNYRRLADALSEVEDGQTIKLLVDINYDAGIVVDGISVTFDLNGFDLNVVNNAGNALTVRNAGEVKLAGEGELNVESTYYMGAGVYASQSKAEVTNAKGGYFGVDATGSGGVGSFVTVRGNATAVGTNYAYGAAAENGSSVTVNGNISANNNGVGPATGAYATSASSVTANGNIAAGNSGSGSTNGVYVSGSGSFVTVYGNISTIITGSNTGVQASSGGKAAIEGTITVSASGVYVWAGGNKSKDEYDDISSRAGYYQYSGNSSAPESRTASTVWVRDPVYTGSYVTPSLKVSPGHAILTGTDTVEFTAVMTNLHGVDYSKVVWNAGTGLEGVSPAAGQKFTVEIDDTTAATALVTAVYDGKYTATASVEILPSPDPEDVNAKLLENAAVVNKAKDVGALVPVLITNRTITASGLSVFALPAEPDAAGSKVIEDVKLLVTDKSPKTSDDEAVGYKARMYGFDDRYIAIDAEEVAKNAAVRVWLVPEGTTGDKTKWIDAGPLKLTVTEKYPKITLKAGELNLAFPKRTAALSAVSDDGICTIESAAPAALTKDAGKIEYAGGALNLGAAMKQAGNVSMEVAVKVDGYKKAYKTAPKVSVKVINTLPKVKLSQASVTLHSAGNDMAAIHLVSGDKAPLENNYTIDEVELSDKDGKGNDAGVKKANLEYIADNGYIFIGKPKAGCPAGKSAIVKVSFKDCDGALYLPLKINLISDHTKLTVSSSVKSAVIHSDHAEGAKIADIRITLNVANHSLEEWEVLSYDKGVDYENSDLDKALDIMQGANYISIFVKDKDKLKNLDPDTKYTLNIGHKSVTDAAGKPKTVAFALTVTGKPASMSVSLKDKIDIVNPKSFMTATVKLTNTLSEIESVKLYEQKFDSTGKLAADRDDLSGDFKVTGVSGNTFKIMAAHGEVAPNAAQKLSVEVVLKNGQTLKSWGQDAKGNNIDKPISIKPAQTAGKAWQSAKAVTLYKNAPKTGAPVTLHLTTPANVKVGTARLNQAALDGFKLNAPAGKTNDHDAFELVRSGENEWSVYFAGKTTPAGTHNPKTDKYADLKGSYTLKVELWAEGTYRKDGSGNFIEPLGTGKAASKPTLVTVKVTVK